MRNKMFVAFLLCFLLGNSAVVYSQEQKGSYRLVFTTFDASSAGNYAYLRDGIQSMFASRLAARDGIEILDRTISEKELNNLKDGKPKVETAVQPTDADYLVWGTLYGLKSGLNIQVVLYPFSSSKEILRFSIVTNTPATLIADVEQLAGEIVQGVSGKKVVDPVQQKQASESNGTAGFITAHPEAAYKRGLYSGTIVGAPGSVVQTSALGGKRNITIPAEMTAMALGDADGDGTNEVFVLLGSKLELFKVNGKTIDKIAETNLPTTMRYHAINVADLDKDGKLEIYLSATTDLDVSSMVMSWSKEGGFRTLAENIYWYIKPLLVPGKGWQLAGQKRGAERTEFIREGVYLLNVEAGYKLSQGERLTLPKRVNLFDFVYADLDGDKVPEIVAIDQRERMKVYSQANELLWVSQRSFGGSKVYLGPSQSESINTRDRKNLTVDEDSNRELVFVPGRLLVADVDKNGKEEIIVNENTLPSFGFFDTPVISFFSRMRTYNDGVVVGLTWNGKEMTEAWRTGKFRGYVADLGFSLLDKVGEVGKVTTDAKKSAGRLFIGHLPNSGSFASLLPGSDESQLTIYDLEFSPEKSE